MGLIARFLPGLATYIPALLNPWVLLTGLAAAVSLVLFGLHLGYAQLDAFEAKVDAQGQIQAAASAAENRRLAALKKVNDDEYKRIKAERDRARAAFAQWLQSHPGGGIVPGAGAAAGSPDAEACYDNAVLDRGIGAGLDRLQSRLGPIVQRGADAEAGLNLALDWALKLNPK